MYLQQLSLRDWRNFPSETLQLHPGVNLFYGGNAQGKTNLLEAIALLSTGHAFRGTKDGEAVRFGAELACVSGTVTKDNYTRELTLRIPRSGKKQIELSRVGVTASALSGVLPCVLFCPEDLVLIKSGPAERRRLMDFTLCQLRPRYAALLSEYRRLLVQKTALLRQAEEKPSLSAVLEDFNRRQAEIGAGLTTFRHAFVRLLSKYAPPLHSEISDGEQLELSYQTVSAITDPGAPESELTAQLYDRLCQLIPAELSAQSCLSGSHRDDIAVRIDGQDARSFASQGQCRTAAVALKLACRQIIESELGVIPLLLLDDILSELDSRRQDFVLNRIHRGQIFITDCVDTAAARLQSGRAFQIVGGTVQNIRDF